MRDAATVACPVLGSLLSLGTACWGCLPQTQEIFFSIHSPTLGLGFAYQESHSIGRYWRRTRLYFPWEPCLADFLAACYRIPVLSQWNNKCLLSSCFAWLWAQSWGYRESTELLPRLGVNLLFPAHHLEWAPLTLMSARTTPKIPRTKHSGYEPRFISLSHSPHKLAHPTRVSACSYLSQTQPLSQRDERSAGSAWWNSSMGCLQDLAARRMDWKLHSHYLCRQLSPPHLSNIMNCVESSVVMKAFEFQPHRLPGHP